RRHTRFSRDWSSDVCSSDLSQNHFGVDIVSADNEPVKSIADGTVILASWTLETGYVITVQHSNELISIYKHNSVLLKKLGDPVRSEERRVGKERRTGGRNDV